MPESANLKKFVNIRCLFSLLMLLATSTLACAQQQLAAQVQTAPQYGLLLGAAWYPEQWPESRWDQDLQLMEKAGIHVVRVGEFAWSAMEPQENRFDFDWLERAIAEAARHHIYVVLGTPTASPPAWLTQKYPDTLRVDEEGHRAKHGNRQHFSFDSPRYRVFCRQIAEEMARRFGHNPNVIGWQIDNEYADPSFDDHTQQEFQDWLKAKYKTLESLNQHWTTAYWSQTYSDWSQITIPVGGNNPGLMLEWKRFISDTWRSYQANQLQAIRANSDLRQFITTNTMGLFDGFDHYVVSADLTLSAWDSYVGEGHADPGWIGMSHDTTRGFLRKNFWVMETQPGNVNWAGINNFLNRGEARAMAWQAIGHGADALSFWQWRSALNGQEQYHGVLVGADGTPVPFYREAAEIGADFAKAGTALQGTSPHSEVAMLHSYDSRWAIDFQRHNRKYDPMRIFEDYYRSVRALTQQMDVVSPEAPLAGYKLVIAPGLNVLPEAMAQHLLDYVRNGGHLVLGPRSGMKDQYNALLPQRQPGFLADPLGGRVEQYYALDQDVPLSGDWGTGKASLWAEQLSAKAKDVQVLLRYGASNGWLDGQPAAISRPYGKGRITYIGAVLDPALMAAAARWMVEVSNIKPALGPVPDGIEVCQRTSGEKSIFVLINWKRDRQQMTLPRTMHSVLGGDDVRNFELPAYGVAVLEDVAAR